MMSTRRPASWAASAAELRTIYANLFSDPTHPERLLELRAALDKVDRRDRNTRDGADRLLEALNDGADPRLTFTQLECLRTLLSARAWSTCTTGSVGKRLLLPGQCSYNSRARCCELAPKLYYYLDMLMITCRHHYMPAPISGGPLSRSWNVLLRRPRVEEATDEHAE